MLKGLKNFIKVTQYFKTVRGYAKVNPILETQEKAKEIYEAAESLSDRNMKLLAIAAHKHHGQEELPHEERELPHEDQVDRVRKAILRQIKGDIQTNAVIHGYDDPYEDIPGPF